jgi:DNA modification methylase
MESIVHLEDCNKIINQDCMIGLLHIKGKSIDCCVTSPPYFGLRDYGHEGQIGLEETPELFIAKLVAVFREVKRVLKDDGTLWVNMGDSYAGSWGNYGGQNRGNGTQREIVNGSKAHQQSYDGLEKFKPATANNLPGIKPKDLIGIPWMLAFALRADGWYLRQDIIWAKPNPMPESVTDRCTKSHEYIFLLSKSQTYYFDQDAIKQPIKDSSIARLAQNIADQNGSDRVPGKTNGKMKAVAPRFGGNKYGDSDDPLHRTKSGKEWNPKMGGGGTSFNGHSGYFKADGTLINGGMANKRSVWTVTTKPFSEAHFATFPESLIVDCIKAGCREGGIVLDPFMGAGTTALVARKLNRNYLGFELNKEYIKIAEKRLKGELGMFL